MMKKYAVKGWSRLVIVQVIILGSLAGCVGMGQLKESNRQCVVIPPVLSDVVETRTGFVISRDDMSKLTFYIEQLRQCADAV